MANNQDKYIKPLDTDTKLQIYGLGKQGRYGDCTDAEPFFLDIANHLKWEAWMAKKGMSMEAAQSEFMSLMKVIGLLDAIPEGECARLTICLADNVTPNPDYVPDP